MTKILVGGGRYEDVAKVVQDKNNVLLPNISGDGTHFLAYGAQQAAKAVTPVIAALF